MMWISQCRTQNFPLDGSAIKEKARSFARLFKFQKEVMSSLKISKRHNHFIF